MFSVTPCVGVWIEINDGGAREDIPKGSLPAWECGLKSNVRIVTKMHYTSLPAWECGLK